MSKQSKREEKILQARWELENLREQFPSPCCHGVSAIPTSPDGEHWFSVCSECGEWHEIPEPPDHNIGWYTD